MTAATTVLPLATYRNETPYPFCPGCGHSAILDRLNEALVRLQLDPAKVVLVTDIGCSGLSDQYFSTSAFHGLHGRSLTYATGIKLARPELEVIVLMGDGGAGIGGAHLINAARRNVGLTLLVFNNLNFGMTGGQHSVTTPVGAVTSTTPGGNLERPLDLCATVGANGAAWAGRATSFDSDLAERIAEAIATPGFALLDIWELCTAYYVPQNKISKKALYELLASLHFETGVLYRNPVMEYTEAHRAAHAGERGERRLGGLPLPGERAGEREIGSTPRPIEPRFASRLSRRFHLVVAGSAGGKVRSAARLLAQGAILSGLYAAQRDDYPITVKTGHSIAELIFSPEPISYTGIDHADALLVLTEDGRRKSSSYLKNLAPGATVFALPGVGELPGREPDVVLDPANASRSFARTDLALAMATAAVGALDLFPIAALEETARSFGASHADANLAAIAAGTELAAGIKGTLMNTVANEPPSHGIYEVLVNQEEELILWPVDQEVPYSPSGWLATGKQGTEQDCLDFIEEHGRRPRG
ncbi:MAG TPA: thiamine pyrophosphate-dependent enzyme [Thermoanaerobaculia bacterium]|nr:thiamine pyrophosphate-dependent enzyme [Thermoanaerobaculia bacterium]